MTNQNSPYNAFATLLSNSGHPCSPAELHGVLLGRSCTGVGFDADNWLADVAELLETEPGETVRNALIGQPVADIDIATTLKPEDTDRAIRAAERTSSREASGRAKAMLAARVSLNSATS